MDGRKGRSAWPVHDHRRPDPVRGLGAVVAASASAYAVLKLAGAAYVVWLGLQAIRHRSDARVALEAVMAGDRVPDEVRSRTGHSLRVGFGYRRRSINNGDDT